MYVYFSSFLAGLNVAQQHHGAYQNSTIQTETTSPTSKTPESSSAATTANNNVAVGYKSLKEISSRIIFLEV